MRKPVGALFLSWAATPSGVRGRSPRVGCQGQPQLRRRARPTAAPAGAAGPRPRPRAHPAPRQLRGGRAVEHRWPVRHRGGRYGVRGRDRARASARPGNAGRLQVGGVPRRAAQRAVAPTAPHGQPASGLSTPGQVWLPSRPSVPRIPGGHSSSTTNPASLIDNHRARHRHARPETTASEAASPAGAQPGHGTRARQRAGAGVDGAESVRGTPQPPPPWSFPASSPLPARLAAPGPGTHPLALHPPRPADHTRTRRV